MAVGSMLVLLAAPRATLASVIVVDLTSYSPMLQSAVDAAASGDILLLKPGAIDAPAGTVTSLAATPRSVHVSSPVREGGTAQLVIHGQVGDLTALFIGFTGAAVVAPAKQGIFALGSPVFAPQLVAVNPVGDGTIPFTAGNLQPAALQGQTYLLQLVVREGSQVLFEGNTSYTPIDSTIP